MPAVAQYSEALADAVTPSSSPSDGLAGEMVLAGAARVATALTTVGGPSDRGEWLSVVGGCQSLINTLTALQDTALAEAARRESRWCEDGTLGETIHTRGRVALDAADLAAPLLGASHDQAQRRVELAVRLAADRVPVPAEHPDLPEVSGLRALHTAMAQGRLDGYRAGVVAFELDIAPSHVADAVVAALDTHLHTDAPTLRKRTRELLSRISPDLVRQRADRARASTGLRRWVAEPGVDEWHGTFPSEDAASAWAAIDELAQELVAAGTCSNIEQARGKALTDLVTGHANVDVQIVLTVPADCVPRSATPSDDDGPTGTTPMPTSTSDTDGSAPINAVEDPNSPPLIDRMNAAPLDRVTADTDVPTAPPGEAPVVDPTDSATSPSGGSDDALMYVQGARPSEPLLVRRGWLRDHLAKQPPRPKRGRAKVTPVVVPCDPLTGARLDPHDHLTTDAYRPTPELIALVKARDGRCRFPGCSVAARFCDLDHVRPWPAGRTSAGNLLTLCRRHHRIKQRPGWSLRLVPDGTTTWTDPIGRVRTTAPLDALQALVLAPERCEHEPSTPTSDTTTAGTNTGITATTTDTTAHNAATMCTSNGLVPASSTTTPHTTTPRWSVLETILELRAEHTQAAGHGWLGGPTHRRCTSTADLRAGIARRRAHPAFPDLPPF
ncbi:MAG: DUF222 domain-containing protein [Ornithinibacter sp.]